MGEKITKIIKKEVILKEKLYTQSGVNLVISEKSEIERPRVPEV